MSRLGELYLSLLDGQYEEDSRPSEVDKSFSLSLLALQPPSLATSVLDAATNCKTLNALLDDDLIQKWRKLHTKAELEDDDNTPPHDPSLLAARLWLQYLALTDDEDGADWTHSRVRTTFKALLSGASGSVLERELHALSSLVAFDNCCIDVGDLFATANRVDVAMGLLKHVPYALFRSFEWLSSSFSGEDEFSDDLQNLVDVTRDIFDDLLTTASNTCECPWAQFQRTTLTREASCRVAPLVYAQLRDDLVLSSEAMCSDVAQVVQTMVATMSD